MDDVKTRQDVSLNEWTIEELGGYLSKKTGEYTLYHKGLEGRLSGLSYKELCQLAAMVDRMVRDA